MTMIEKVARALHTNYESKQWEWPVGGCAHCMKSARAAIEAMHGPTEDMLDADLGEYWEYTTSQEVSSRVWASMIEAALK